MILVFLFAISHLLFILYIPVGGFLAWKWKHAVWPWLASILYGVALLIWGFECPLTTWENWARRGAGLAEIPGFIDYYLSRNTFEDFELVWNTMSGTLVAVVLVGLYLKYVRGMRLVKR